MDEKRGNNSDDWLIPSGYGSTLKPRNQKLSFEEGRSRSVAANPFKNKQKINKLLAATERLRQHSETVKPEVEFRGGAVAAP